MAKIDAEIAELPEYSQLSPRERLLIVVEKVKALAQWHPDNLMRYVVAHHPKASRTGKAFSF